jgi:acid phosphatase
MVRMVFMSRFGRRTTTAWSCAALLAVLTACGGQAAAPEASPATPVAPQTSAVASPSATSPAPASSTTTQVAVPGGGEPISKVLVVVVENHSLDSMRRGMPWTFALAQRYGYATGYRALTHPSLPNYLAIAGGDTFGISDDKDPTAHVLRGPSVFGQALAGHRTAKVYAEDMPAPCSTADRGRYAVRHNPWTYFADERAACEQYDVPITALAGDVQSGDLPNVGMVVPNVCSDAHDCPLSEADRWLRDVVGQVMAGPDFTSGRLLVVITADEDDHGQGNLVLTAMVNRQITGTSVHSDLSHYSLSGLLSQVAGAQSLRRARSAPPLGAAFGLAISSR